MASNEITRGGGGGGGLKLVCGRPNLALSSASLIIRHVLVLCHLRVFLYQWLVGRLIGWTFVTFGNYYLCNNLPVTCAFHDQVAADCLLVPVCKS